MDNITINGTALNNLPTLTELFKKSYLLLSQADRNGRFVAGKLDLSTFIAYLSQHINIDDAIVKRDNNLIYATLVKSGELVTGDIFGSFESMIDYELIGLNIYVQDGPNGSSTDSKLSIQLYDYQTSSEIGETSRVQVNTSTLFKQYATPITLFAGNKYGIKIIDANSVAPINDISVQLILRVSNVQSISSIIDSTTVGKPLNTVNNLSATVDPNSNDDSNDGYVPGSIWINTVTNVAFIAISVTAGTAIWQELGSGGGGIDLVGSATGDLITWDNSTSQWVLAYTVNDSGVDSTDLWTAEKIIDYITNTTAPLGHTHDIDDVNSLRDELDNKLNKDASNLGTGDDIVLKTALALENVENTSDNDKPISEATQQALDATVKWEIKSQEEVLLETPASTIYVDPLTNRIFFPNTTLNIWQTLPLSLLNISGNFVGSEVTKTDIRAFSINNQPTFLYFGLIDGIPSLRLINRVENFEVDMPVVSISYDEGEAPVDIEWAYNNIRTSLLTGDSDKLDPLGIPVYHNLVSNVGAYSSRPVICGGTF